MPHTYQDVSKLKDLVRSGGPSELKIAISIAEKIASLVQSYEHFETVSEGRTFFRARNSYDQSESLFGGELNRPLNGDNMGPPPKEKSGLGRFNSKGTSALYLSSLPEVALAEVRAIQGQKCTVAQFQTLRETRIAKLLAFPDRNLNSEQGFEESEEERLLIDASVFVSRRILHEDRNDHYRCCNLIGSAIREHGFDGIAYRTSFWSPSWGDESAENFQFANIVLFDPKVAQAVKSSIMELEWPRPISKYSNGIDWNPQKTS